MNLDELCMALASQQAARWGYTETLDSRELAAFISRATTDANLVADVKQVLATLAAAGDPHAEALLAGREVGAPCFMSTEYLVRWHGSDGMDGTRMTARYLRSPSEAGRVGADKIGDLGITCFSIHKCEHRRWADGSAWIGPDVFVAGPLTTAEVPEAAP